MTASQVVAGSEQLMYLVAEKHTRTKPNNTVWVR